MAKSVKLFESKEEIIGKHLRSKEWIMYSGRLTIYDRPIKPVILKIKSEIFDSFISMEMDDSKEFTGENITQVYQKLSSWFNRKGVKF
jgi:hypothetical protein